MKIYIAGKITGENESDVQNKFFSAKIPLIKQGHKVMSPAVLTTNAGFEHGEYIHICYAMIEEKKENNCFVRSHKNKRIRRCCFVKTILKYPGAKNRLASWIVSNMPSHEVYLEPFFGSGAVFFNKKPCRIETINDIDDDVYNFFNTVRKDFDMLADQIRMTPFSRTEYENAFKENENDSSLEKARKFAVKCFMGFGASNRYKNGFRSSQQSSSPSTTKIWNEYPERLLEACSRLKNAQIENLDYRECLSRYDTKDVFIYADPPYMPGVRKKYIYKHEMDEEEHRQLLSLLLAHPGKVMISGYDTPLYSEMLKGWKKEMHKNQVECGLQKNECIWMNY